MNLLDRCNYKYLPALVVSVMDSPLEKPRFRAFATQRLGMLSAPDEHTVNAVLAARLRDALQDKHVEVRREALLALTRIRDAQAVTIVRGGLQDPKWSDSRDLIIRCLYDLDEQSSMADIRRYLSSSHEQERIAALFVLGEWRDKASALAFSTAADEPSNPRVRRAGLRAQQRLSDDPDLK